MSLTHRDLAGLVSSLYGQAPAVPWLYRSNVDANVYMGIIRKGGYLNVTARGSFDLEDWFHDLRLHRVVPAGRPELGAVHEGFYSGTPEAADIIDWYYEPGDKLVLSGHSLGADRASMLAGHMIARGRPPHFICTWGEPAGGIETFVSLVGGIPSARYCNTYNGRVDRVTQSTLPFGYVQAGPMTDLAVVPDDPAPWDPFELHHFALYESVTPDTPIP